MLERVCGLGFSGSGSGCKLGTTSIIIGSEHCFLDALRSKHFVLGD